MLIVKHLRKLQSVTDQNFRSLSHETRDRTVNGLVLQSGEHSSLQIHELSQKQNLTHQKNKWCKLPLTKFIIQSQQHRAR